MAKDLTKSPHFRGIGMRRFLASKAEEKFPVSGDPNYNINTTVLPNNIVVASAENKSAISRVAIFFRAGARFETATNWGVTHLLRIAAGLSTRNNSQFAIMRSVQQVGSCLTCSTDRELIGYTLEGTRSSLPKTLPFLGEIATQQCFRAWEVKDSIPRVKLELANVTYRMRVVDLLHKAAYRSSGLGNSLYLAKHKIEKISPETLQKYVTNNFVPERTAIVGLGVAHKTLLNFAKELKFQPAKGAPESGNFHQKYQGGEIRSDKGGDFAYIAIAGRGGSLRNAKEALSFAILQRALGAGGSIKHTKEQSGLIAKALKKASDNASMKAINISYLDSGLFGVLISAPSDEAGSILSAVMAILFCGKLGDEDFSRGKNQLKTAVLLALENGSVGIEDMGIQASLIRSPVAVGYQIASAIDTIEPSDVNAALAKVGSTKMSMASIGNLSCVPFLDAYTSA